MAGVVAASGPLSAGTEAKALTELPKPNPPKNPDAALEGQFDSDESEWEVDSDFGDKIYIGQEKEVGVGLKHCLKHLEASYLLTYVGLCLGVVTL